MNFHVLTLFPEMIMNGLETSILGRAAAKGIVSFEAVNIRDYTLERHGKVDDYPYGGGAGMVMQAEPIYRAYTALCDRIGHRPRVVYMTPQGRTFTQKIAEELAKEEASLLVLGNTKSPMFPHELLPFTARHDFGKGGMKINFLVNYSWEWDLGYKDETIGPGLKTAEVSRIDLIIRWGGRRRLSGFLPVQSVYSDFYVVDDYWPDFKREHVEDALKWYAAQDITLGG